MTGDELFEDFDAEVPTADAVVVCDQCENEIPFTCEVGREKEEGAKVLRFHKQHECEGGDELPK